MEKDMMSMIAEMSGKIDMIMQHLGCSAPDYKNMPDEEKDKMDEQEVLGKEK